MVSKVDPNYSRFVDTTNKEMEFRLRLPTLAPLTIKADYHAIEDKWMIWVRIYPALSDTIDSPNKAVSLGPYDYDDFPNDLAIAEALLVVG